MDELETLHCTTVDELRSWLDENDSTSPGVWLVIAKKGSAERSVSYAEAVDAALQHGWIDGQAKSFDADTYRQRYTPRRAQSIWSKKNVDAAEAMIAEGRMAPRGVAEVERARADGRWERAYEGSRDAQPHPDFLAALAADPAAAAFYETLNSQNRYAIYFRIQGAKREDTRARRIATFVEMLARGERFHL